LRAGISPKVISERLGHSKVGFTPDVYAHLLPGMQEEAAQKVDVALRQAFEKQRRVVSRRAVLARTFVYPEVPFAARLQLVVLKTEIDPSESFDFVCN